MRQNENMKNLILISGLQGWFSFRINLSSLLVIVPTISAAVTITNAIYLYTNRFCYLSKQGAHQVLWDF